MGVNLSKGQRVKLGKDMPLALIGLGWDVNKYDGGNDFDLDASAFLLDSNGKVRNDSDFIFYGNLKHSSGSVCHTGDNRTGEGDGDDQVEGHTHEGDDGFIPRDGAHGHADHGFLDDQVQ